MSLFFAFLVGNFCFSAMLLGWLAWQGHRDKGRNAKVMAINVDLQHALAQYELFYQQSNPALCRRWKDEAGRLLEMIKLEAARK